MKRYLVDLKDVADRHLLYREEHAQEKELQLELLREKIRTVKDEAMLRDGFKDCFCSLIGGGNASVIPIKTCELNKISIELPTGRPGTG